ncbi:MAG: PfkB family carbohydrate kinase [Kiritimatiellae bacterium]|nr:PfkB family carbohydrate kinase [Kiritimatiellia bacterium]
MSAWAPEVVVVGSVGLDTITTPRERREEVIGGSASYACAAAARLGVRTAMIGVVGEDFPAAERRRFERLRIGLAGLQTAPGRTFRWSGEYAQNMNERRTICTQLNVFENFRPELPAECRVAPFLFLANIAPSLQLHVLGQMERRPRLVVADTMDLWIRTAPDDLRRLLRQVDLLMVNESEAEHLSGCRGLRATGAALLKLGPRWVIVKRGEYGSVFMHRRGLRVLPAYPVVDARDPTGAGDTFAGGLIGRLALEREVSERTLCRAMVYGTVMASFAVEAFGLDWVARATRAAVERRVRELRRMCRPG